MKLEHKLYLAGSQDAVRLTEEESRQLQSSPELQAVLSETEALRRPGADVAEPPSREALLARVYANVETTQEKEMKLIYRLFSGKPAAMRLALAAALVLALLALSLLLPRAVLTPGGMAVLGGAQAAYAATEGYILVFDFGDAEPASLQPIIDQLTATMRAFQEAHNIPQQTGGREIKVGVTETRSEVRIEEHVDDAEAGDRAEQPTQSEHRSNRAIAFVALPDASLLDELKAELAKIPGLPEPRVIDATWFSEHGLALPGDDGIKLQMGMGGDALHSFNFPKDATKEEIEQAINAWLAQNEPDKHYTVTVTEQVVDGKTQLQVKIDDAQTEDSEKSE